MTMMCENRIAQPPAKRRFMLRIADWFVERILDFVEWLERIWA